MFICTFYHTPVAFCDRGIVFYITKGVSLMRHPLFVYIQIFLCIRQGVRAMIESLMFYAYTFSEIIGFCTIFLIVLLYRRKTSDQMLPLKNLGCFQIFAFGIGMIYFAHRYLSIYNGDKTYVTLLRGADITFFILMQFYWLHYLQKSIQIVS